MNFFLFSQGPLYQFYLWLGLAKKPLLLYRRRIIIISLFTWVPLLILTLFNKVTFYKFINDFDVHMRLLVSLPLLLYAEVIANDRFQIVIRQFINCNIISEKDRRKYDAIISSALRLSNSITMEIILFVFIITIGRWISQQILPLDISTWYIIKKNTLTSLTLPGYWYIFISLPIFQFILFRWYYRIIIWYHLLWQVSHLQLQLNSFHPDKTGGIGFLVNSIYGLWPFLMAHSFLLADIIFNSALNSNTTFWQLQIQIMAWLVILVFIAFIPMTFFIFQLTHAKRNGTNEYDIFANHYVTDFCRKWIDSKIRPKDKLLGNSDIQSLAGLNDSFNVSAQMRILPFDARAVMLILLITALPFFPLIFTIVLFQ